VPPRPAGHTTPPPPPCPRSCTTPAWTPGPWSGSMSPRTPTRRPCSGP
jgi:hypothetical protein